MSARHRAAALSVVLAVSLAACTSPEQAPTNSAEPSPSTTPATSAPASPSPSASPSPAASPSASATPTVSATPRALTIPDDWTPIDAEDAGVSVEDVDTVLGAWRLPNSAVASIVRYRNDVGSADPEAVFTFYFGGEDSGFDHEEAVTASGQPVLIVDYSPEGGNGGDSQAYFFVLTDSKITAAVVSGGPDDIDDAASQVWAVIKRT